MAKSKNTCKTKVRCRLVLLAVTRPRTSACGRRRARPNKTVQKCGLKSGPQHDLLPASPPPKQRKPRKYGFQSALTPVTASTILPSVVVMNRNDHSCPDWLSGEIDRLGLDPDVSEDLTVLLQALHVPNASLLPDVGRRLLDLGSCAGWLLPILAVRSDPKRLSAALEVTHESDPTLRLPSFRFGKSDVPLVSALQDQRGSRLADLEPLRAVMVLGALGHQLQHPAAPAWTALTRWASRLRAIDQSYEHADRELVSDAADAKDLRDLIDVISAGWPADTSQLATDWHGSWAPFLSGLLHGSLVATTPPPAVEGPPSSPTGHEDGPDQDIVGIPFGPSDAVFEDEPAEDSRRSVQVATPSPSKRQPDSKLEVHWGRQSILQSNHMLVSPHAEGYLVEEVSQIGQIVADTKVDTEAALAAARKAALTGISLCTSSTAKRVGSIGFRPTGRDAWIDLAKGELVIPILRPAGCFKPQERYRDVFWVPAEDLRLPLPPMLLNLIGKLYARFGGKKIRDWFPGVPDLNEVVRQYLASLDISAFTKSPARLRRAGSALFQEAAHDLCVTMTLAADPLGHSLGALHYYSDAEARLQDLFTGVFWPAFGSPVPRPSKSTRLVGPAWVAREPIVKRGVSRLSNALNWNPCRGNNQISRLRTFHNSLTDALASRVAFITSNRPHESLFCLTRFSFDTRNHYAILSDKCVDPEHRTRPAALTAALSRQIELYLLHLAALRDVAGLPPSAQQYIEEILAGSQPLFGYISEDLELHPGDVRSWKASWPSAWEGLPANWYRTFLAKALRDAGVEPMALMTHMGHFDAAGHPCTPDSPVSGLQWLAAVRPALEALEARLGFKNRTGLAPEDAAPLCLPPLRAWDHALEKFRAEDRAAQVQYKLMLRSMLKENRLAARDWLEKELPAVNPTLAAALHYVHTEEACPPDLCGLHIDAAATQAVLDAIADRFADNLATRIGVHNLLCRRLRRARNKLDMRVIDIGLHVFGSPADPSPFLPDLPLATMHIFEARAAIGNLRSEETDDVTRRALGLCLFGMLSSLDDINRLARSELVFRSNERFGASVFADTGLGAVGFRGPVALSMAANTTGLTTTQDLAASIARTLPPALVNGSPATTASLLCSTAGIARRIEQSGLAEFSASPDGCVDAPADVQAAFLGATLTPSIHEDVMAIPRPRHRTCATAPRYSGRADSATQTRYSQLLEAVGDPRLVIARAAGEEVRRRPRAQKGYVASLDDVKRALAVVEPPRGGPLTVSTALWGFAHDMATHGTRKRAEPEPSTIYSYVSILGADLIAEFSGFDLLSLDREDFESAYAQILSLKGHHKNIDVIGLQIQEFHNFLSRQWGIEPIDRSELGSYFNDPTRPADATLVSEAEYLRALKWLLDCASFEDPAATIFHAQWRRRCRAAATVLLLLWRSGARISEISWLRHCDFVVINGRAVLVVRPSMYRRLKTKAARRLVRLWGRLTNEETNLLFDWIADEKLRRGARFESTALLFPEIDDEYGIGSAEFRRLIENAFRSATGRHIWPHLIRHSWASREMAEHAVPVPERVRPCGTALRSVKTTSVELGHTRVRTTFSWYVHVSWLFVGLPDDIAARWCTPIAISALTGWSVDSVYRRWSRQSVGNGGQRERGLSAVVFERCRPEPFAVRIPELLQPILERESDPFPFALLGRMLTSSMTEVDVRGQARAYGFSRSMSDALLDASRSLAERCHYRLIELPSRRRSLSREPSARPVAGYEIEGDADPASLAEASALFAQTYRPRDARLDCLSGDAETLARLVDCLTRLGIKRDRMQLETTSSGAPALAFRHGGTGTGLHFVCSQLAIGYVRSFLTRPDNYGLATFENP